MMIEDRRRRNSLTNCNSYLYIPMAKMDSNYKQGRKRKNG
jgi:hypothetical protein